MKRIIASLAVFASMSFVAVPTWAGEGQQCSNATLQGSYGFQGQGFNPATGHNGSVGIIIFDGQGNVSGRQTLVNETRGVRRVPISGTYEVNPDCTGTLGDASNTNDLVIASGGNEVFGIATTADPPGAQRVITYVLKKQFPQD